MDNLPVEAILRLASEHKISRPMVFGSRARGDNLPSSDLDLLVDVEPGTSLFDLIRFEQALEDLLNIPVEVLTLGGLNPRSRDSILKEAKPLSAA